MTFLYSSSHANWCIPAQKEKKHDGSDVDENSWYRHISQLVGCTVNMHKFLLFCCTFDTQSVFAAPSSQYKSFRMELWDLFFLKSALIKSTRRKTNLKDHIFKCSHTRDKHIYLVSIQREKCAPFNHHIKHK